MDKLEITDRARDDADAAYDWMAKNVSQDFAEKWYLGLFQQIESLMKLPTRRRGNSKMAKKPKELPIPPDAVKDSKSIEMIRVWIANEKLQTSLNIGVWGKQGVGEETAWGMMLADVIQHVANAFYQSEGTPPEETIRMIKRQLDDELDEPTSEHPGNFVEPVSENDGS